MKLLRLLSLVLFLLFLMSMPLYQTGCGSLKPVPVAEGHDPVVVYAERAQRSSLRIYEEITEWEFLNRNALSADVSRAVDSVRKEFPPAWRESRKALEDYKQRVPGVNASTVERITGALLVFQDTLLRLKKNGSPTEIAQVTNALGTIITSVRTLFNGTNQPPALQPQP
jgi:hypothetical protein